MNKNCFVYIMASGKMGTIYIGSTSNLSLRVMQHKNKTFDSFTAEHSVNKLVYYEHVGNPDAMVKRERQMKEWQRNWKLKLIIKQNPDWRDLTNEIMSIGEVI
ncbi:MAG: GIY-YIG nuclease family protein [Rickettsiales bacterium]|jgi:putative endonuclease|nr:GIY-YIG nuclease family protein [Rickettsiales bacterium]